MQTEPELDVSTLTLVTRELSYEQGPQSAAIAVELLDNQLALEQPQQVSLGIILSSSECYDLTIPPTLVTILDNDGMLCSLAVADIIVMRYMHNILLALKLDIIYSAGWQEWAGMPAKTHTENAVPQVLLTLPYFEQ